ASTPHTHRSVRAQPAPRPFPYTALFRSRRQRAAIRRAPSSVRPSSPASRSSWTPYISAVNSKPRRSRSVSRAGAAPARLTERDRSEEHTSELQSHLNIVCRLLLEKKKQT